MNKQRITPAQLRRLQVEFKRLAVDGQVLGPRGEQFAGEEREVRLAWARAWLGVSRLGSFLDLSLSQAGFLLDICAGKPTKLDVKLQELFAQYGIAHPDEWLREVAGSPRGKKLFWTFQGRKIHELNRYQKWRLADLLVARVGVEAA